MVDLFILTGRADYLRVALQALNDAGEYELAAQTAERLYEVDQRIKAMVTETITLDYLG